MGDAASFKLFRYSTDFTTQKVYFSRLMRVCVGLIKLSGMHLVQVSFLSRGSGHFFWYRPLLSIGWRIVQILRQSWRKTTSFSQPLLMQYKQQANPLLSMHYYTPLVISGNDKNKEIAVLSQRKLTLNR